MLRLSVHFEKEHRLNEKVKAALTYPIVVMAMAVVVVVFVLTFHIADLCRHVCLDEGRIAAVDKSIAGDQRIYHHVLGGCCCCWDWQ